MKESAKFASRHRRTRRDHAMEMAEDYVEAIADIVEAQGSCRVVDLTKRFGVSHVTVTRTVARLQQSGFVVTEPYRPIRLTRKGFHVARRARRRHGIVLQFLLAIGVDPRVAAIDAEGIEHHVSSETLKRFRDFTRRPGSSGAGWEAR
jgi:DtxR family manganese transport transcriptional regulator